MSNVGLDSQEALFSFYYQQSRKYDCTDQTCWGTSCSPQPRLIRFPAVAPSPPVTGVSGLAPGWGAVPARLGQCRSKWAGQRRESCLDGMGPGTGSTLGSAPGVTG